MLVETARKYWEFSQRMHGASSDRTRQLIMDHEVLPAAYAETDPEKRKLLFKLVDRMTAVA